MASESVRVRLFASLRELAGTDQLELELQGDDSLDTCWRRLCERFDGLASWRDSVRPARNLEYVEWETPIEAGDELAFLPPVSGGSSDQPPAISVKVGPEPIDEAAITRAMARVGVGAIATFIGLVRDPDQGHAVPELVYEAYPEMAEPVLAAICAEACQRFGATEAQALHRTGRVPAGVASVAVLVGAAHRRPALDACAYIIDELKSRAPIWKSKE
ncbi:MAG TPA: molybdenum cofactor biosynthesis protein MoaE [Candidatus Dormibacteraeota bacterium]